MRILLLSPFVPFPPRDGGRIRILELLRGLSEHHDVEVLALADPDGDDPDGVAELRRQGYAVGAVPHRRRRGRAALRSLGRGSVNANLVRSRELATRLAQRLSVDRFQTVQCEYADMGAYRTGRPGPPGVLDAHNVEYAVNASMVDTASGLRHFPYRAYARREAARRRREEIITWSQMDHVVTVSEVDRATVSQLAPIVPTTVVPNGVDLARIRPPDPGSAPPSPAGAVFVGKMDYRPNVDAVEWFVADVLPAIRSALPDFELTVVGGPLAPAVQAQRRSPGVQVTGRVADPLPFLHRAAVAVVPVRARSGSRLKLLEALAAGTPVVSTPAGAEGLDVIDGEHLLLAEDPAAFAAAVVRLSHDHGRRQRLATAGRRLVEARYGWGPAVEALRAVHERVVGEPSRA